MLFSEMFFTDVDMKSLLCMILCQHNLYQCETIMSCNIRQRHSRCENDSDFLCLLSFFFLHEDYFQNRLEFALMHNQTMHYYFLLFINGDDCPVLLQSSIYIYCVFFTRLYRKPCTYQSPLFLFFTDYNQCQRG